MKRLPSGDTFVLDFDPKCGCGNHATHLLTMHAVDHCTPERPTVTEFVCNACLTEVYRMAAQLIHPSAENDCTTCHLTFDKQCNIIVSLLPIPREKR